VVPAGKRFLPVGSEVNDALFSLKVYHYRLNDWVLTVDTGAAGV
jgi:hypothetical protein